MALVTAHASASPDDITNTAPVREPVPESVGTATAMRERAALVGELLHLPYLTPDQVAVIGQTSAVTIRRACAAGRLRAIRLNRKHWRITPEAVRAWLASPTPEPVAR